MKSNKTIRNLIFGAAAFFAVLCLIQLAIYLFINLSAIKDALANGEADKSGVWQYCKETLIPQIITYITSGLGVSAILFACGMIYCKKADDIGVISDKAAFEVLPE